MLIIRKKLAHELFHAYDYAKEIFQDKIPGCANSSVYHSSNRDELCHDLFWHNRRETFISDDKRFQNLAQLHGKSLQTFQGIRVLNPYELESAKEFSATNFSAFIYDSEYQCRRPLLYHYFKKIFAVSPHHNQVCQAVNSVIPANLGIQRRIDIVPARIYQIDYLMAAAGTSIVSRFGHAMIRFVVCAPTRQDKITGSTIPATKYGEDCLADTDYHFVASFRATIAENSFDIAGSFNGKYPSQMVIIPFKQVLKEYNELELRDLSAYPLEITNREKNDLIKRTLETFWEYNGSYKFISNNCASETFKFIIGAIDKLALHLHNPNTPNEVLKTFVKFGLIQKNYQKSIQNFPNYYFKSKSPLFEKLLKNLSSLNFPIKSLQSYLNLPSSERRVLLEDIVKQVHDVKMTKKEKIRVLSSLTILETQAFTLISQALSIKKTLYVFDLQNGTDETIKSKIKDLIITFQEILKDSYGIPSTAEFSFLEKTIAETNPKELATFLQELYQQKFQKEENNLKNSFDNFVYLIKEKNMAKQRP